jgi:hypothetical protein
MAGDFDWLDEPATDEDLSWLDAPAAKVREEVKQLLPAKAPEPAPEVDVRPANKIACESMRGRAMFQHVQGRKRIWACDGEYVFFRRPRAPDGSIARDAQGHPHAAIGRHERFISNGDYTYVETQDDVEVCKVNPQSTFARKGVYLGEMSDGGVRMAVVVAACMRDWGLYVDTLEEFARRIKNKFHGDLGTQNWQDQLTYVQHLIDLRRGPSADECGQGIQQVRRARGEGSGRIITMPPRGIVRVAH